MFEALRNWWRERGRAKDSGAWGERRAESYLVEQEGFSAVARNWRNPRDRREEIDLVMADGEVLVFVEVKARASGALVPGYHAVNPKKKRILLRAAKAYLRRLRTPPRTFRFDVVEIELAREAGRDASVVRHFANVPLFPKGFRP